MAQRQYSFNLKEEDFPLISIDKKRTVIGATAEEIYSDVKPGLLYCHNVIPTKQGLVSAGYIDENVIAISGYAFVDIRTIYGTNRTRLYLAFNAYGQAYILVPGSTAYISLPVTSIAGPSFDKNKITTATVKGITYIYYSNLGCFQYNEATQVLDPVILSGVVATEIIGIVDAYGYLVAYSISELAWSSTLDPTDLVPSDITGAGGGAVTGIGGDIIFCTPHSFGFLVFSDTNAVAVTYTGNAKYPFKPRVIDHSKGGINSDLVAYESQAGTQFVYTKAGLQAIDVQKAETFIPELTDFLESNRIEDFDETALELTITNTSYIKRKIKFIASRYLIVSYGATTYTHAIVYDIILKRMGKLKIDHVDLFEYATPANQVGREAIGVLKADGSIYTLDTSHPSITGGVVILGKLQFTKTRMTTLLAVDIENVADVSIHDLYSLDGRNTDILGGTQLYSDEGIITVGFRKTAKHHSLLIKGKFCLATVIATYILAGNR